MIKLRILIWEVILDLCNNEDLISKRGRGIFEDIILVLKRGRNQGEGMEIA